MGFTSHNKMLLSYTLPSGNPSDATTYTLNSTWTSGVSGLYKYTLPFDCVLKSADITIYSGTVGTAEDWTMEIYKNGNPAGNIATLGAATAYRNWVNNDLNIDFNQNDDLQIVTTTPTWATNPSGCLTVYILGLL